MLTCSTIMNLPTTSGLSFSAAKDIHSNYVWATKLTAELFGYAHIQDLVGRCDTDIPLIADLAEQYMQDDQKVMASGSQTFIEKVRLCHVGCIDVMTMKTPYYDENQNIAGIFFNAMFMKDLPFDNFISFFKQDNKFNIKVHQVVETDPQGKLSPRELEVLFFTLRGKTAKMIAKNLAISVRTIESHLNNIKDKLACHNKQQLIEYADQFGYTALIPKTLLQYEYQRTEQFLMEK